VSLVKWILKKLGPWRARAAGCDRDDLFQAGLMGLWRATLTWDKRKGSFATVAYLRIRGEMIECLDKARFGKHRHGKPLIDHAAMLHSDMTLTQDERSRNRDGVEEC
jgi:DNA-directed RNA polymerase specialized sigma subunit